MNDTSAHLSGTDASTREESSERERSQRAIEEFATAVMSPFLVRAATMAEEDKGPPPASEQSIRRLPTVVVIREDFLDETNRHCSICFEENLVGDRVARLPCGHLYHRNCIIDWLKVRCTCPICRYELPTAEPDYEEGRIERMSLMSDASAGTGSMMSGQSASSRVDGSAAGLDNAFVFNDSYSSSRMTPTDQTSLSFGGPFSEGGADGGVDADRAAELDNLIDQGDWTGVVTAASRYSAMDNNPGTRKVTRGGSLSSTSVTSAAWGSAT